MPVTINAYVPSGTRARLIEQRRDPKIDTWFDVAVSDLPSEYDWSGVANKNTRFIIQEIA